MKRIVFYLFALLLCFNASAQTDSVKHEIVIVLENTNYNSWNATATPYIKHLMDSSAVFTAYNGIEHPSENNYYVIGAGINYHIPSDGNPGYRIKTEPNGYTQLAAVGKTCASYIQALPDNASTFSLRPYYAKHDWMYAFANIPVSARKKFTALPADLNNLENLVHVVLDINNDGHDTGPAFVNNYFKTDPVIQKLINFASNPKNKTRIWINTDEDAGSTGNRVLCFVYGYNVKPGALIATAYNHYNFFNTTMASFGAASCNQAIGKPVMTGWQAPKDTVVPPPPPPPVDTNKYCWKYSQRDTLVQTGTRDSAYTAYKAVPVYGHQIVKDSVKVICQDTASHYFVFGFYEQYYNQTATSKSLLDALIRDVNDKKITDLHCYDVRNITPAQIQATNSRLRNECPTLKHIVDCTTNGAPHDGFDGVNNEIEPWTWGSKQDSVWVASKAAFTPIVNNMKAQGKQAFWHFGWWNTSLMAAECPKYLINNTTAVMLHYYRASPTDYTYLKSRLDAIEANSTGVTDFIAYPSYEVIYGQNWSGTMLDWYNGFNVWFKAQNYKHIRLIGVIGFTRQLYDIKHPVPPANAIQSVVNLFRSVEKANGAYQGFDSKQTIHIEE